MLPLEFFDRDAQIVAKELLGKVLCVKHKDTWLSAIITETEAYYIDDKASHSYRGCTKKCEAMFMPAGTIYMYYCRGHDSLNISVNGKGNAILVKSAQPYLKETDMAVMQKLNPNKDGSIRKVDKLCAGQTLLCKSLGLMVKKWNKKQFDINCFYIKDIGHEPTEIIQTTRLGIPKGKDEDLPLRFIYRYVAK